MPPSTPPTDLPVAIPQPCPPRLLPFRSSGSRCRFVVARATLAISCLEIQIAASQCTTPGTSVAAIPYSRSIGRIINPLQTNECISTMWHACTSAATQASRRYTHSLWQHYVSDSESRCAARVLRIVTDTGPGTSKLVPAHGPNVREVTDNLVFGQQNEYCYHKDF